MVFGWWYDLDEGECMAARMSNRITCADQVAGISLVLLLAISIGVMVEPAPAAITQYPVTNALDWRRAIVWEYYSGIVERAKVVGIGLPEYVETFKVYAGNTGQVVTCTNATGGVYQITNYYDVYESVTLTNQFGDFGYTSNITGTNVITSNRPHVTLALLNDLDNWLENYIPYFVQHQAASNGWDRS